MKTKLLDAKLEIEGLSIDIGHELFYTIVKDIPDVKSNIKLFELLSNSSYIKIRAYVAKRENINRKIVKRLLSDKCHEVLDDLLDNDSACKLIKKKELLSIINKEEGGLLYTIARKIRYFNKCDINIIAEVLSRNSDPEIRHCLAMQREYLSENIIKKLSKDIDYNVALHAKCPIFDI